MDFLTTSCSSLSYINQNEVNSMIYSMNSLTFAGATTNVDIVDIIYYRNPSMRLQSVNKIQVEEAILRQLYRSLYNNIPSSYMENIVDGVVPAIGVDFEEEKDVYTVKVFLWLHTDSLYFFLMFLIQFVTNFSSFKQLSDNTRPDATVFCKCILLENKKLHLYKAGFVLPRVLSPRSC